MACLIILIILITIIGSILKWYLSIPKNLPPGPIGLPFLGSSFDTWKALNLHKKIYRWTKTYGPVYKFYVAEKLVVVLGDWNAIHDALVQQGDAYSGRPELHVRQPKDMVVGAGIIQAEGTIWKVQRRFALSTLREFGIGRPILEPKIREEASHLIKALDEYLGKPCNPTTLLGNAVANVVSGLVFGRRFSYDDENFQSFLRLLRARLTEANVSLLAPFVLSKNVARLLSLLPKVKRFTSQGATIRQFSQREISKTRHTYNPNDEPKSYIEAYDKARTEREEKFYFTDDQLEMNVMDLFIAGTESTSTTISWGLFYLAHYPEWQEKIYHEIMTEINSDQLSISYSDRIKLPLTQAFLMETQRMANLNPIGVFRRTFEPTKIHGYDIPRDTVVVPLLTGVLRDPSVYLDPDKFNPNRFIMAGQKNGKKGLEFTYWIPFQTGKRICPGESLAKMELFIFLTTLVSKFQFQFPSGETPPSLDDERFSFIRGPPPYEICFKRRNND